MPEPKSFRPRSRVSDEAASAEASPRLVLGPRGDTWEQKAAQSLEEMDEVICNGVTASAWP